jgi:hypothetical protein
VSERNPDELGALWVKHGAKGEYMTGEINGVKVVCFRNTRAENNERAPQWRVMKSQPRETRESATPTTDKDMPF